MCCGCGSHHGWPNRIPKSLSFMKTIKNIYLFQSCYCYFGVEGGGGRKREQMSKIRGTENWWDHREHRQPIWIWYGHQRCHTVYPVAISTCIINTPGRQQSKTLSTIKERRSRIIRNSVFDCHLSPNGNQKHCFYQFFILLCRLLIAFSISAYPVW